jgi:hypothetical protein
MSDKSIARTSYDPATGQILLVAAGSPNVVISTIGDQPYVEGKGNRETQKVVAGQIVDKTQQELDAEQAAKENTLTQRRRVHAMEIITLYQNSRTESPAVVDLLKQLEIIPSDMDDLTR